MWLISEQIRYHSLGQVVVDLYVRSDLTISYKGGYQWLSVIGVMKGEYSEAGANNSRDNEIQLGEVQTTSPSRNRVKTVGIRTYFFFSL